MKLMIVDDERDIVMMLRDYFELSGYRVVTALGAQEALDRLDGTIDLILLDVNMPGMDGLELCKRIRGLISCPILFLTARVEDQDKIAGFLVGGDDYIEKPFGLDALGARVAAHLRREERIRKKTDLRFRGNIAIDMSAKTVSAGDRVVPLAKKEYEIVEFLAMNAGQVFDRERIYERLWGYDGLGDSAVVAEHIRRIRAKFSEAGAENPIETVWGLGYKWAG